MQDIKKLESKGESELECLSTGIESELVHTCIQVESALERKAEYELHMQPQKVESELWNRL